MTELFDDDALDRFMRDADPALTPADAPLTVRHVAIRDRIMMGADPEPQHHRAHPALWLTSLPAAVTIVIVALIVITGIPLASPAPAVAQTPLPLQFVPIAESLDDVLASAASALGRGSVSEPQRQSRSTGWYMNMEIGQSSVTTSIVPEDRITTWNSDRSGTTTVRSGYPYSAESGAATRSDDLPAPGTLLYEMHFRPGDFDAPVVDPPGSSPAEMSTFLTAYGASADGIQGGLLFRAIETSFDQWTLTNPQHASILSIVAQADDVELLGATTDRVGRDVVGLRANFSPNPKFDMTLLISSATGRIVGIETTTREALSADLPAGSVTSYTLWETQEK